MVVINILLLIFSSSLRYTQNRKESREKIRVRKPSIYPLKARESEYQEAV